MKCSSHRIPNADAFLVEVCSYVSNQLHDFLSMKAASISSTEGMTESTSSTPPSSVSASQQQVSFNKAIAKVSATKDKRIAELEAREKELVKEQNRYKGMGLYADEM